MIHVFIINARRMPFQAPSANVTATRVKAYVSKVSNIYEEKLLITCCVPVCACQCVPVCACLPVRACVCMPVLACAKLGSDCGSGAVLFRIHTDERCNEHLQIWDQTIYIRSANFKTTSLEEIDCTQRSSQRLRRSPQNCNDDEDHNENDDDNNVHDHNNR